MTFGYDVIHDGVYYKAGEEIPQSFSDKKEEPKAEKEVVEKTRKKRTTDK